MYVIGVYNISELRDDLISSLVEDKISTIRPTVYVGKYYNRRVYDIRSAKKYKTLKTVNRSLNKNKNQVRNLEKKFILKPFEVPEIELNGYVDSMILLNSRKIEMSKRRINKITSLINKYSKRVEEFQKMKNG